MEFGSAWAKLFRAAEHAVSLQSRMDAYWNLEPLRTETVIDDDDPEVVRLVLRVEHEFPAVEVAMDVGDTVHNMRSALDHAALELVELGGGTVGARTGFPIPQKASATVEDYHRQVQGRLKGASSAVVETARSIEPIPGGHDEVLWALHHLDILDKHRVLIVVGTAHRELTVDLRHQLGQVTGRAGLPEALLYLAPHDGGFGVQDGHVLATLTRPLVVRPAQLRFGAAFGEPDLLRGVDIHDALSEMLEKTRAVLDAFQYAESTGRAFPVELRATSGTAMARRMGQTVNQFQRQIQRTMQFRILVVPDMSGSHFQEWEVRCEDCDTVPVSCASREDAIAHALEHRRDDHEGAGVVRTIGGAEF